MPRSKGGEPLEACEGCYTRKLSFRTGGRGGRSQKVMGKRGTKKPGNSSKSDEESRANGKEWLRSFSTMKVGPPRHVKPTAEPKRAAELKRASLGAKMTSRRTTSRLAGLEAKRRLHRLRKFKILLTTPFR